VIDVPRRWAVLRAIAPQLPLFSAARWFSPTGNRGPLITPRVYSVSGNDHDQVDAIARALGVPATEVWAQLEDEPADLFQRAIDFLPPERLLTFERFAFAMDEPQALELWWGLHLPVLSGDRAWIGAQLCGRYGAEDHAWIAELGGDGWSVRRIER
jgi:hypothetical protein